MSADPAKLPGMTPATSLKISSPAELLAAVPYLLGFHPSDSVTVVAFRRGRVHFAGRHDLPPPDGDEDDARTAATHLAAVVAREAADGAVVIGYGAPTRVTPAVLRTAEALRRVDVPTFDVLRVTGGRFWSYLCDGDDGCPDEGWPCPPEHSAIAAAATYAGHVALPDRDTLVAQLAPVGGAAMIAATVGARERLSGLADSDRGTASLARRLHRAGRVAVRDAERRYRSGGRLSDDEVAWLGVVLGEVAVRDYAWERIGLDPWQLTLWTDVVRRVEPEYVPAPAALLGFAAWRAGAGALAWAAVERSLAADPAYGMAQTLREILTYAVSPAMVDGWPAVDRRDFDPSVARDTPHVRRGSRPRRRVRR
jgi:Domain of unknown function (DUF4192)